MFVVDARGAHIVDAYPSMDLILALYVTCIVSFCFPIGSR